MKKPSYKNVYQFKIILKYIKPPIWRRIQVPESYSFWDLHVAIQDSMGWQDYHLHDFVTIRKSNEQEKRIGIPDCEGTYLDTLPSWEENISDWFSLDENKSMNYIYDFGDNWEHRVELERIIKKDDSINYPACIKGARACPPEDCGGVWGYEDKLNIIKNPNHPEHDEILEWMGTDFNQEEFDCAGVIFDDPAERLKASGLLEQVAQSLSDSNKANDTINGAKGGVDWEIDYSELPYHFKNEKGEMIKVLLMLIVHPESYFIFGSHLALVNSNYLQEFSDQILAIINEEPSLFRKIFIKKKALFDFLQQSLKTRNVELELIGRTRAVEVVNKDMNKMFKPQQQ